MLSPIHRQRCASIPEVIVSPEPQSLAANTASLNGTHSDEELWDELLQLVEEGRVVPIVGRDLLSVQIDGEQVCLYPWLSRQLAEALGVTLADDATESSLNAVASQYLAHGGEPEKIYNRVHKLLRARADIPIPTPLEKLASIQPFKLFVSTTFDALLAQAINAVRFGGVEYTKVIAYSPRDKRDLPGDVENLEGPVVFQLLGKVSPMQDYVVTEEDALEFVYSLQTAGLPVNLFSALDERPLLIIGCSFPGWLVRFFIRAARRNRLLLARGKTDFVVDATGREEPSLLAFLRNFKTRTEFFQQSDPVTFVNELHRRWQQRLAEQRTVQQVPVPFDTPTMNPGAVFLSYASDDHPAAAAIRDALDAAGIDVWFDRHRLMAGELFENKIRRHIERCSLFIPVLSKSCVTPERRFFRLEWDHAQRVAITAPESSRFIVPVVIDDLPPDHEDIPARFRAVHWERLPGGQTTPAFVETVKCLYREFQSRTVVRA
jgi:hypothetical protein